MGDYTFRVKVFLVSNPTIFNYSSFVTLRIGQEAIPQYGSYGNLNEGVEIRFDDLAGVD
jgi:hypothetical protein